MPHLRSLRLLLPCLLLLLAACSQQPPTAGGASASQSKPVAAATGGDRKAADLTAAAEAAASAGDTQAAQSQEESAHRDHDSKHGGTFFMALDNKHHLEGALERPGVFRLYVYDAFTQPVKREELGGVEAKVIWGGQDGAPEVDLKPNDSGGALEAPAPEPVRFPITLTLLCRFPGASANGRPEVFTFPFSHYSHIDIAPHTHLTGP